ncbi:hypothetical protein B566_EDAN006718 [Ephemera danica]|nr:hypothetical protein B566_EDAN006718 [Ephemera danica]
MMKVSQAILGKRLFHMLMKGTFYGHFVAGEDQVRIRPTIDRLRSFGVKSILDYSVEEDISTEEAQRREVESCTSEAGDEQSQGTIKRYHTHAEFADRRYKVESARTYFYLNEAQCERNMDTFLKCLEAVSGTTSGTGITAVKLTALGRPQLLLQLSEVIMRARRYFTEMTGHTGSIIGHHVSPDELQAKFAKAGLQDEAQVKHFLNKLTFDKEGVIHLFPWSGIIDENAQLCETFRVPDLRTGRMFAKELDVRLMVDAEQTYFQPAITRITLEMMRKHNKEKAIMFNTYQCYLKEAFANVATDLEQAKRQDFYFGAKLVRGAYLEQERARAEALGYEDPTNPNYEATSEMYERTLSECLLRITEVKKAGGDPRKIAIMVASHNEDTVRFALKKMQEYGISPADKVICFGQLLGMCDYITFPLGQAGYSVYKYIPYGPVNEVLPYLSRRAQENKGILKKIKKEKSLLLEELKRRAFKGQLYYTPRGNYVPI